MRFLILLIPTILLTSCDVSKEEIDIATKICNKFDSDINYIRVAPGNWLICSNGNTFKDYSYLKIEETK